MTKEKKVDDVDLDDGLDFQDFEMGFEELGDDREPKSKPAKSFAKGVKKGLTDTEQIKSVFRKNLPPEYAAAYGKIDDVFDIMIKLKENNVTQIMKFLSLSNASLLTEKFKRFNAENLKKE
jgi:hypothetical protein